MMKKRTETTIETHQVRIVRRHKLETQVWCAACAAVVRMVTPESAAVLAGVTRRTIYRWIEAGKLHFAEMPDGALLICTNSLTSAQTTQGDAGVPTSITENP